MRSSLACLFCVATSLASPTAATAQEQPFQSYEAGAWYLTTLELTLMAEIPLSIAAAEGVDGEEAFFCGVFFPLCVLLTPQHAGGILTLALVGIVDALAVLVVPSVSAAVADAEDAPVDFPVVFNLATSGAISFGFLGGGALLEADAGPLGALIGAGLGIGGGLTYSLLRLDELARDPRVGVEMNFLTWAPAVLGPLSTLITAATGADPWVVLLVSGLTGVLSIGASIAAIEVALTQPLPTPMGAPLVGSAVEF